MRQENSSRFRKVLPDNGLQLAACAAVALPTSTKEGLVFRMAITCVKIARHNRHIPFPEEKDFFRVTAEYSWVFTLKLSYKRKRSLQTHVQVVGQNGFLTPSLARLRRYERKQTGIRFKPISWHACESEPHDRPKKMNNFASVVCIR